MKVQYIIKLDTERIPEGQVSQLYFVGKIHVLAYNKVHVLYVVYSNPEYYINSWGN